MENIANIINKKYIMLSLLVLIIFSSLYFIDSSNSAGIGNNNTSNEILENENSAKIVVNRTIMDLNYIMADNSYVKSGYNESDNVILKFKLRPANDPHLGGVNQVWVDLSLHFKNNQTPIPNQMIYMITGIKLLYIIQIKTAQYKVRLFKMYMGVHISIFSLMDLRYLIMVH